MEGRLEIVVMRAVEPDNMPQLVAEIYAEYPLIILSQNGKREIARLTVDKSGNYRIALPPGAYILAVQERPVEEPTAERIDATQQPFTVVPNQTVRVDMTIVIGRFDVALQRAARLEFGSVQSQKYRPPPSLAPETRLGCG